MTETSVYTLLSSLQYSPHRKPSHLSTKLSRSREALLCVDRILSFGVWGQGMKGVCVLPASIALLIPVRLKLLRRPESLAMRTMENLWFSATDASLPQNVFFSELAINPPGPRYLNVYTSSFSPCFHWVSFAFILSFLLAQTAEEIGISSHVPQTKVKVKWDYKTLENAPALKPENEEWVTSIYRGIVPAKNIENRDFAIAGATVWGYYWDNNLNLIASFQSLLRILDTPLK